MSTILMAFLVSFCWSASAMYYLLAVYPETVDELPDWYRLHIADDEPEWR